MEVQEMVYSINSEIAEFNYTHIKGVSWKFNHLSEVKLNLKNKEDRLFTRFIRYLRLPQLNIFHINGANMDDPDVDRLLVNSTPKWNRLHFNTVANFQLDASKYISSLKIAASRAVLRFHAHKLNLKGKEMIELLSASKFCTEGIYLYFCNIDSSKELQVGSKLDGWKTKNLYFNHSGKNAYLGLLNLNIIKILKFNA